MDTQQILDGIALEVNKGIEHGEFDSAVRSRAEDLGIGSIAHEKFYENAQYMHRRIHPSGPWSWEYCSGCGLAPKNTI